MGGPFGAPHSPVPPSPLQPVIGAIGAVLLGKEHEVRLALACLLARGHLLIEDLPGMGKTTLAEALARSFGLGFKRVSFTSDLLPADLTGLNVFDPAAASRPRAIPSPPVPVWPWWPPPAPGRCWRVATM